ncbi:hypothetical protein IFM51744_10583 [Aspergillus udagawae]|nr:hypothetical protein IFM51744_10583 [Aspergillus udagawae]
MFAVGLELTEGSGDSLVSHIDPAVLENPPNGSSYQELFDQFIHLPSPGVGGGFRGTSHDLREPTSNSEVSLTQANHGFSTADSSHPVFRLAENASGQDAVRCSLPAQNIDDQLFSEEPVDSELSNAKEKLDMKYHRSLELMATYKNLDGSSVFLNRLAEVVKGSSDILRSDLADFAEKQLRAWFEYGLWPPQNHSQTRNDTCHQLSRDIQDANLVKDPETQKMLRRVARARLYLLFCEHKKEIEAEEVNRRESGVEISNEQGAGHDETDREMSGQVTRSAVGVRKDTRAIDTLLGRSVASWMGMDPNSRDQYRRNFLKDRKTGKRWCELAHYFGPGVLVTCGTKIDRLMYVSTSGYLREELIRETRNGASSNTVQALAMFIDTCFPEVGGICRMFDNVAETFLGRRTGEKGWWEGHIQTDSIKDTLKRLENHTLADNVESITHSTLTPPSDTQLTTLLSEVLRSEENRRIEDGL